MILLEPQRTPYDLSWRMLGTDVRVHPMFWLLSAILGWNAIRLGIEFVLVWVVVVFISILVHEFGHVFMGRVFGSDGHIVLYSFGGLAVGSNRLASRWQRIAVLFAGPGAGFILAGLVWLVQNYALPEFDPANPLLLLRFALMQALYVNLFWGLLNLVPIWPLDGGQISRDLLTWMNPRSGVRLSLGISFLLAALLAIIGLLQHLKQMSIPLLAGLGIYAALMFGMLALQSFQLMQQAAAEERWTDQHRHDPWD